MIDFEKHKNEVQELWEKYNRRENERVPIAFATDEQFWLKYAGKTFKEFYTNPKTHLEVQLETKNFVANNIIGDSVPGIPDRWGVSVQLWMEENEFYDAEVVYQENDYAWAKCLPLSKEDLLKHLADLDPEVQVKKNSAYKMYLSLCELAEGKMFLDKPINIAVPGGSTHGIFTKAAELRGLEQMCMDIYDDPEWVEKYLSLFTEKTIARIKAWHKIIRGTELQIPSNSRFHICDDSIQMISQDVYEQFVLPHHLKLYNSFNRSGRGMHLCGRSMQHYKTLHDKLGILCIDGPGVFADHGEYLKEFGGGFSFQAQTDHTVLGLGTAEQIEDMVKQLLRPETKIPGRFNIIGFIHKETRLENIELCYNLVRKYGIIDK
ncbi:MAG: uroporphyrinogen decarboxylase family protein [Elusimicrobiota bacterium]